MRILGPVELGLAAAAFVGIVTAVAWPIAKLIDRKEPHFGAALSSGLTLAMVGCVLGLAFLALQLRDLCDSGAAPMNNGFLLCAGISGLVTLVMVHGAFGTAWWRSAIMLPVLSAAALGGAWVSHKFILENRAMQLPILAAQTAGLKTDSPSLITTEPLKKVAAEHSARAERKDLDKRQEGLVLIYNTLVEKRSRLNAQDPAAVAAFNELATAYSTEKAYVQKRKAELGEPPAPPVIAAQ